MKICQKCSKEGVFSKDETRRDGLSKWCKSCMSEYHSEYRKNNVDKLKQLNKIYSVRDADKRNERSAQWNKNNPERRKAKLAENYQTRKAEGRVKVINTEEAKQIRRVRSKQWKKNNQGRVNATLAKRRADILRATPHWAEHELIIDIYNEARMLTETTGIDYEVDHIIPLNSPIVCGLHCVDNLQILTAEANNRKKCKLPQ